MHGLCCTTNELFSDHLGLIFTQDITRNVFSSDYKYLFPWRYLNLQHKDLSQSQFGIRLEDMKNNTKIQDWSQLRTRIYASLKQCGIKPSSKISAKELPTSARLNELIKERRKCSFKSTKYRELSNEIRNQVKYDHKQFYRSKLETISSTSDLFQQFKISRGSTRVSNQSVEEVANHLFSAFKNPIPETSIDLESLKSTMAENVFESEPFQFNLADLKFALSECASKSAPGPDGLSYNIFHTLSRKNIEMLTKNL